MNLLMCRVAFDFGMLVLIWLVQLIIYPSFEFSEKATFIQWHERYTGLITIVVLPLMIGQLGLTIAHLAQAWSWTTLACLGLIAFCWIVTFTLSVPAHNQLQSTGNQIEVVRWLVATNWLRTIGWTAISILSLRTFFMLSK
jgi:hypothetical protein